MKLDFDKLDFNLPENYKTLNRILLATYGVNLFEIEFIDGNYNDIRTSNVLILN